MRVTGVPREVSFMAHVQTAHRPTGRRARRILGPLVSQTSVRGCGTGPPGRGPRGRVAGAGAVNGFAASVGLPCRVWTGRGRASQVSAAGSGSAAHLYLLRVSRRLPHTPGPSPSGPRPALSSPGPVVGRGHSRLRVSCPREQPFSLVSGGGSGPCQGQRKAYSPVVALSKLY